MLALLLKLADQLNSSVFVLITILVIAFWAIYKLGGIVNTFSLFKEKHKDLDTHVSTINTTLASIKATTDLLYQAHLSTVKQHSPISLTTKGAEISTALQIENKIANHWTQIKQEIEKKSPSNPYDIQVVAIDIARNCFETIFSEEEKSQIKLYAYQTGNNLLEIFPIIGVLARDKYLTEKGLTPAAVDQHTPKS